jgi:hypothetical protein
LANAKGCADVILTSAFLMRKWSMFISTLRHIATGKQQQGSDVERE